MPMFGWAAKQPADKGCPVTDIMRFLHTSGPEQQFESGERREATMAAVETHTDIMTLHTA